MNKAHLWKQAWRIPSDLSNLMAFLLLSKYCSKKPFTEVQPRGSDSWVWKSLLEGTDVCLKGLDVQVWNGNQSCIINNSISVTMKECKNETLSVKQLICSITHTWNTKKMNPPIDPNINSVILRKAFSIYGGQAKFVWRFKHDGNYSVKLAYHILANNHSSIRSQSFSAKVWERLWSLKIPFKLIIFLCKICNDCLPTRVELHKRIQNISPSCPICQQENESLEHLFFLCPLARAVWFGTELSIRTDGFALSSIKDWIHEWLSNTELSSLNAFWFYG